MLATEKVGLAQRRVSGDLFLKEDIQTVLTIIISRKIPTHRAHFSLAQTSPRSEHSMFNSESEGSTNQLSAAATS